jgi:collagenase-like PrtC family protease
VICQIDSVRKARFFQDIGIDRISVSPDLNRDPKMLRAIRRAVAADIEILVNSSCLLDCPVRTYHYNVGGHASQVKGAEQEQLAFFCATVCRMVKLRQPEQLIRGHWVRPEDIESYDRMGIQMYKVQGRTSNPDDLLHSIAAYLGGTYRGNLVRILGEMPNRRTTQSVTVDNAALDGFSDFFYDREPDCHFDCDECGYCIGVTNRVVKMKSNFRKQKLTETVKQHEEMLEHDLVIERMLNIETE